MGIANSLSKTVMKHKSSKNLTVSYNFATSTQYHDSSRLAYIHTQIYFHKKKHVNNSLSISQVVANKLVSLVIMRIMYYINL